MAQGQKDPIGAALDRSSQLDARPWNVFFVDAGMRDLTLPGGKPIKSIALIECSPHELRQVFKRCQDDVSKMAQEQVAQALVAINCDEIGMGGEEVSLVDGSADKVVARMHPRVLDLAMNAYNELHENTKDTTRGFLKSRKVITRT